MQAIKIVIKNLVPYQSPFGYTDSKKQMGAKSWLKFISKLVKFISAYGLEIKIIEMREGEE